MKKEHEAHDWKEGRRLRAWERWPQGGKQKDSASALGLSKGAVSHWLRRAKAQGKEALYRHPAPGAQPKLSPEQLGQLPSLLNRGAEAFGFRGQVWTAQRVAEVIKRQYGVSYHPGHCSRLLERLKYSVQKPVQRASQRDEAAIQRWKDERWPALKKKLKRRNERSCS
jgi:transposase